MAAQPIVLLTPEQYLEIERRAETKSEFFEGVMYAMSGVSLPHALINGNLFAGLHSRLRGTPCMVVQNDVRLCVNRSGLYTYPDIMVVCGEPRYFDAHVDTVLNPAVVIEILSPSTERHDRIFKASQYRAIASVREYLMVSQNEPRIERFRRGGEGWELAVMSGLGASCDLESLGVSIPLAEIYDRIEFPQDNR